MVSEYSDAEHTLHLSADAARFVLSLGGVHVQAGLLTADKLLTVSPTYAEEMSSGPQMGVELDDVIRSPPMLWHPLPLPAATAALYTGSACDPW